MDIVRTFLRTRQRYDHAILLFQIENFGTKEKFNIRFYNLIIKLL